MADEEQSSFKVTDRRLFNPDGTLREDIVVEPPPPIPAAEPLPAASPLPENIAAAAAPSPADEFQEEDADLAHEQTLFTEFLMGIASSAFIYLGLVEHPATGRRQVNLQAAQESIEMLRMLREKTKGNLTRGEEKFFDDLLADLQMQFVSMRG